MGTGEENGTARHGWMVDALDDVKAAPKANAKANANANANANAITNPCRSQRVTPKMIAAIQNCVQKSESSKPNFVIPLFP